MIKTTTVRRKMSKGEVSMHELGCEHDVFTFCLYNGSFAHFDGGEGKSQGKRTLWPNGVIKERWEAAEKRATQMMEQCADADPRTKMAMLRTRVKGSKTPIKFMR